MNTVKIVKGQKIQMGNKVVTVAVAGKAFVYFEGANGMRPMVKRAGLEAALLSGKGLVKFV